jgi:hypothetical protein
VSDFSRVIVGDFEYETSHDDRSLVPGDLPEVLCGVFHELEGNPLQVVRTHKLWRREFGPTPPFDVGSDTLFVAYSAWAEMTCFLVLAVCRG